MPIEALCFATLNCILVYCLGPEHILNSSALYFYDACVTPPCLLAHFCLWLRIQDMSQL